ncbi:Enoyl-CoA hydratase domain-containing protein 1 [Tupaia chinensis]|uniref:Enoyl-CoA hydratase domain-containing protein 1 n=1 Tax=Tupaia chinensis TaxID=246437 RepID=L9L6S2_TUPCH|nr:Enoyl-CoA hydratase domain-containing protein 1 [Tupaia chinensis]
MSLAGGSENDVTKTAKPRQENGPVKAADTANRSNVKKSYKPLRKQKSEEEIKDKNQLFEAVNKQLHQKLTEMQGELKDRTQKAELLEKFQNNCLAILEKMANSLLKTSVRTNLLHQTGLSLYSISHGFHEEEVKKKLHQFPGGSVDLQKEDNGIGILTLNNPSKMNAFSGVMMLQLLDKVIELENWTEGKGLIVRGAKNTFSSGSDLNAVKALATPEASV